MGDFILWCNANQGLVMVFLTAVYVVATVVFVCMAAHANAISRRNIDVLTELEQERSRPLVEVRFENSVPWLSLKITNRGQTPAYDVRLETAPKLLCLVGGDNCVPAEMTNRPIGIVDFGIGTLGAGVCEEALVGSLSKIREYCPDLQFMGKVSYRSASGRAYETPVKLDVRHIEGSLHESRHTMHDLVTVVERIERELHSVSTGFHKLHVITEDIEHRRARDKALVDELRSETEQVR